MFILTVNGSVFDVTHAAELEDALAPLNELQAEDCSEVCLSTFEDGQPGPSLTALVRGRRGWLMYLRGDGDPGFSTRNPSYAGGATQTMEFLLSNGQVDEYPASWTYPTELLRGAFLEFFRTGDRPRGFEWFDDGAG